MSASLLFMIPARIFVGSTTPKTVARKNIGPSTTGVVEQNGPRHPASCRFQSVSRVYTCLLSALCFGEGWFNGKEMQDYAESAYCFYAICNVFLTLPGVFLKVFPAFSWCKVVAYNLCTVSL